MAYVAPTWVNGASPAINATNLQNLSDAVEGLQCYPQVTKADARNALGLGNTDGALPIANGGTGATTAATACANIGALNKAGDAMSGSLDMGGNSSSNISTVYKDVHRNASGLGVLVGHANSNGTFYIYDQANSKDVLIVTANGAVTLNGNAATATKLATARSLSVNLASASSASFDGSANAVIGVSGTLPISSGGTGSSSGNGGLQNLFAAGATILSSYQYGNTLPASGTIGQIFFKKA